MGKKETVIVRGQQVELEERTCTACNRVKFRVMVNSEQELCSQLCAGDSGFKWTSKTGGHISVPEMPAEVFAYVNDESLH